MNEVITLLPSLVWRAVVWAARQVLPTWLIGVESPCSHGSSRWAKGADRDRLGRSRSPEKLAGDGVVLGFFNGRVIESPREDNVLLLGVQRSGKTSSVVVPTLL